MIIKIDCFAFSRNESITMVQHEYGGNGIHHQGIEMLLRIILTFCDITNFLWLVSFSMLKYVVAYLRL